MKFTEEILKQIKYVILDADALNSFQHKTKKLLKYLDKFKLITPHKKEFSKIVRFIKSILKFYPTKNDRRHSSPIIKILFEKVTKLFLLTELEPFVVLIHQDRLC